MSNHPHLPRFPLVDLGSTYMSYLEEIDVQNQSRHYCGEVLLAYPSFEEFIVLCCDVSFDAPRKPSAFVQEIDEMKVLDVSREDELPLKAFLWLPEFANLAADEEDGDTTAPTEAPWATAFGSFEFVSSSKH